MKTIIVLAILFVFAVPAFGQPNVTADELFKTADDFRSKSKPESAVEYYEKAAVEFSKAGNNEKAIDSYNQIGAILNRQDKYAQAKAFLGKALEIGRTSNKLESLAIATTYLNLGVTYGAENNFEESLKYHNKALSIRLAKLGTNNADVATSYGNIGNIYFRMKEYDRAIDVHLKAKEIREKVFGKNGTEVEQSYRNLGNAFREKKEYKQAINNYEKALAIKIAQVCPKHKDLIRYYKSISEVYGLMGDKALSEENRLKAEAIERE